MLIVIGCGMFGCNDTRERMTADDATPQQVTPPLSTTGEPLVDEGLHIDLSLDALVVNGRRIAQLENDHFRSQYRSSETSTVVNPFLHYVRKNQVNPISSVVFRASPLLSARTFLSVPHTLRGHGGSDIELVVRDENNQHVGIPICIGFHPPYFPNPLSSHLLPPQFLWAFELDECSFLDWCCHEQSEKYLDAVYEQAGSGLPPLFHSPIRMSILIFADQIELTYIDAWLDGDEPVEGFTGNARRYTIDRSVLRDTYVCQSESPPCAVRYPELEMVLEELREQHEEDAAVSIIVGHYDMPLQVLITVIDALRTSSNDGGYSRIIVGSKAYLLEGR